METPTGTNLISLKKGFSSFPSVPADSTDSFAADVTPLKFTTVAPAAFSEGQLPHFVAAFATSVFAATGAFSEGQLPHFVAAFATSVFAATGAFSEGQLPQLLSQSVAAFVISDGYENTPAGALSELARLYRRNHIGKTRFVQLNPVYQAASYQVKPLFGQNSTAGIRDAEELLHLLPYIAYKQQARGYAELNTYLNKAVENYR